MILTYKFRVKDGRKSCRRLLQKQAAAVNIIWNFCAETDRKAYSYWKSGRNVKRPSAFDLSTLCRGVSKELGIHSDTIDAVCHRFALARSAIFPRTPSWRSVKRSLPWIPFSNFKRPAKLQGNVLTVLGHQYRLWMSRDIPSGADMRSWNFSADSRGHWYVNIQVEAKEGIPKDGPVVGVDLGLKALATLSDGAIIDMPAFYRRSEQKMAKLQSFGMKRQAVKLASKIANQRRDYLHKVSFRLVSQYSHIVIGNVSPSKLRRSKMAKSIHDAGWTMLRHMLLYKAMKLGARAEIVSERYSTATCSTCKARSGPKGIAGLRIREWICDSCGAVHDRDVNAAQNILLGAEHRPLAEETPRFVEMLQRPILRSSI